MKALPRFAVLVLASLHPRRARARPDPVHASEFQVSQGTTGYQYNYGVSIDRTGRFVVTWTDDGSSSSYDGFGRLYDAAGDAEGGEFLIDPSDAHQYFDEVAKDQSGRFIVAWQEGETGVRRAAVPGRRDARGRELPRQHGDSPRLRPSRRFGSLRQLRRRVDARGRDGHRRGRPPLRQLGRPGRGRVRRQRVYGIRPGGARRGEICQRLCRRLGRLWRGRVRHPGPALRRERKPRDRRPRHQRWVRGGGRDERLGLLRRRVGRPAGCFARRYDAAGAPLGGEIVVNTTYTSGIQASSRVVSDDAGNFIVSWTGYSLDGDDSGVAARMFDRFGTPVSSDFIVNTTTTDYQYGSQVALNSAGKFVVTWQSPDDDAYGVFARRGAVHAAAPITVAPVLAGQPRTRDRARRVGGPWTPPGPIRASRRSRSIGTATDFSGPPGADLHARRRDGRLPAIDSRGHGALQRHRGLLRGHRVRSRGAPAPALGLPAAGSDLHRPAAHLGAAHRRELPRRADAATSSMRSSRRSSTTASPAAAREAATARPTPSRARRWRSSFSSPSSGPHTSRRHAPARSSRTSPARAARSIPGSKSSPISASPAAAAAASTVRTTRSRGSRWPCSSSRPSKARPISRPPAQAVFDDVPCTPGTGFSDWIEELFDRGVTGGCSVTPPLYCPTNPNNRGQMAVFLVKTFGLVLYGG